MKKNSMLRTNGLICVIIIVGFVLTSLIGYRSNQNVFRQNTLDIGMLVSNSIYQEIDAVFAGPVHASKLMASDDFLIDYIASEKENEDFTRTIQSYLQKCRDEDDYDSAFFVSAVTKNYYHYESGIDRVMRKGDPEDVWYFDFLESDREYELKLDNDEVESANNEITAFVNCKVRDKQGEILGVIGIGIKVDTLQKLLSQYEQDYDIKAYLVNQKGDIEISSEKTGFDQVNLFDDGDLSKYKNQVLIGIDSDEMVWYENGENRGLLNSRYIPNLSWYLVVQNDTTLLERQLNRQFLFGFFITLLVLLLILILITCIVKKYKNQIVNLTVEREKKHHNVFQSETAKIYESIYEIDITHNCAASEETEEYFKSLGCRNGMAFDKALQVIAEKQIKKEFRQGYLDTFLPEKVLESYREGIETLQYDFLISQNGHSYYWMRITARLFLWEEDRSVRMFVFRENIDEAKQRESEMMEKMERDSLTDLYNKAATQSYINSLLQKPGKEEYVFFILDIDNFKEINDTLGHATGDLVIAEFAGILQLQFRKTDVVGRIGGDEFVVFISVPDRQWAEKKAQSLIKKLNYQFIAETGTCAVSTSIGAAVAKKGESFENIYRQADLALYESKKNGKNMVTFFDTKCKDC